MEVNPPVPLFSSYFPRGWVFDDSVPGPQVVCAGRRDTTHGVESLGGPEGICTRGYLHSRLDRPLTSSGRDGEGVARPCLTGEGRKSEGDGVLSGSSGGATHPEGVAYASHTRLCTPCSVPPGWQPLRNFLICVLLSH